MHPLLIYIHGFNSSSRSHKAEQVRQFLISNHLPVDFLAPTLGCYPEEIYQQLRELIHEQRVNNSRRKIGLIGSSLGGFMATGLAESMGLKAVLVNPAVHPYQLIRQFLGDNVNPHTGERYTLGEQHINELRVIEPESLSHPENLYVMLQTGDETLDYSVAKGYYSQCPQLIEEGGDHSFTDFDRHIIKVLQFLELLDN